MFLIEANQGFVVLFSEQREILEVIFNSFEESLPMVAGMPLKSVFDPQNYEKVEKFFKEIEQKKVAFGWELNVKVNDQTHLMFFYGGAFKEKRILIASFTSSYALTLLDDLIKINNEQSNELRKLMKTQMANAIELSQREKGYFDQLTLLNNELSNIQRELYKKNLELQKINDQKSVFLGIAAHDLRNPLQTILLAVDSVRYEMQQWMSADTPNTLTLIEDAADSMLRIIKDFLDYSQMESGGFKLLKDLTDYQALVEKEVLSQKLLAAKSGKDVILNIVGKLPLLLLDSGKISQVLMNLIGNAVKFSPALASVYVEVRVEQPFVITSVKDHGPGILEDQKQFLFQPFSKLKQNLPREKKGTGLGLYISKKIIDEHGGKIVVSSEPGKGATFTFFLS